MYVVSTVVSVSPRYYICDAGSKTLSSDMGAHCSSGSGCGLGAVYCGDLGRAPRGPPLGVMAKLSEEHGWIERDSWRGPDLGVGSVVSIIPNHSCPTMNLHDTVFVVRTATGETLTWAVEARGGVH